MEIHRSEEDNSENSRGRIGSYFIKLLREIPMVVISILIALQVDNWNEGRKDRKQEEQILTDLLVELKADSEQLVQVLDLQLKKKDDLNLILTHLHQNEFDQFEHIDSLYGRSISMNRTFFPEKGVYEAISSSGQLELIENDLLKYRIANLYERYYTRLIYNGELYDQWVAEVDWNQREFVDKSRLRIRKSEDIQSLEFHSNVDFLHSQTFFYTNLADSTQKELTTTISDLEKYMDGI